MTDFVDVDVSDAGVVRITIDNRSKLNCLTKAGMKEFVAKLAALEIMPALRVGVLTGAGDRAFVGGASIDEMAALDGDARSFISLVHQTCDAVRRLPFPVIGRINGYALGAGLELAAACDFRVASSKSVFAMPEVRLGIPSVVEAVLLPGLIGWGRTRLLLLTGRSIDAETALQWGLIEELVSESEIDDSVEKFITDILSSGNNAVRLQKKLIRSWETTPIPDAVNESIEAFSECCEAEERKRLMAAYLHERDVRRKGPRHS